MSERKISLAPQTLAQLSPPEQVVCAAKAGYAYVGLRLIRGAPDPAYPIAPRALLVRETAERLAGEGIEALDIEVVRLDGKTVIEDCRPAIEAAALLGGRHLVVGADDPEPARLAHDFAALCELARLYGLTVDVEPVSWCQVGSVAAAAALVRESGQTNAGVVLDPLHIHRSQESLADAGRIAGRMHFAQICDATAVRPTDRAELLRQARDERLDPGEGDLDLVAFLRGLPADLPLAIEAPKAALAGQVSPVDRARAALEATQALLARL